MYPLVLDLAAGKIPVAVACRVLGFSKQAFYKWQANPVTQRDWDDAHLSNAAIDIHHDDPSSGTGSSPTSSPATGVNSDFTQCYNYERMTGRLRAPEPFDWEASQRGGPTVLDCLKRLVR